jgi:hypothetical protein
MRVENRTKNRATNATKIFMFIVFAFLIALLPNVWAKKYVFEGCEINKSANTIYSHCSFESIKIWEGFWNEVEKAKLQIFFNVPWKINNFLGSCDEYRENVQKYLESGGLESLYNYFRRLVDVACELAEQTGIESATLKIGLDRQVKEGKIVCKNCYVGDLIDNRDTSDIQAKNLEITFLTDEEGKTSIQINSLKGLVNNEDEVYIKSFDRGRWIKWIWGFECVTYNQRKVIGGFNLNCWDNQKFSSIGSVGPCEKSWWKKILEKLKKPGTTDLFDYRCNIQAAKLVNGEIKFAEEPDVIRRGDKTLINARLDSESALNLDEKIIKIKTTDEGVKVEGINTVVAFLHRNKLQEILKEAA